MRGWIVTLIVLAALGGGVGFYVHHVRAAEAAVPSDTYDFTAETGDVTQSVASTGSIVSNRDVSIKCRAGGQVVDLPYDDVSQAVKANAILMQIDPTDEQRALDQAEVTLEEAKSKEQESEQLETQGEDDLATATETATANIAADQIKYDNLQKSADRQKQLLAKNLAAPQDYETAQSDAVAAQNDLRLATISQEQLKSQQVALEVKKLDVKLAQEEVQLDQSLYDVAKLNLSYCTVNAPTDMDGVISAITVHKGDMMQSALDNVSGGVAIMVISDMSKLFVLADVDESDIGGVQPGQSVSITADSFPGVRFKGKVIRIAPQGVNTSNVVTFEVKIEVTSENKSMLKLSMTTNVTILEAAKKDVVMVPMQAVTHKQGKSYLTLVKADGSNEDREVETGINDGSNIEISSGLAAGEVVLVHKNLADSRWTAGNQQGRNGGPPMGLSGGGRGR
jgi:HlyD family secretion protein